MSGIKAGFDSALAWMRKHSLRFVEDLAGLIEIESVSRYEEGALFPFGEGCADVLNKALEIAGKMGLETENHEYYCGSVLLRGTGEKQGEIAVMTHLDVVPKGENWTYSPYQLTVEGDLLIGRGVGDDKGPSVASIYALRYLLEQDWKPKHDIRLILGCNEESGMRDMKYYCERKTPPLFAFTPDCAFPVCNAEKGVMIWEMTVDLADSNLVEFYSGFASNAVPNRAVAHLAGVTEAEAKARLAELGLDMEARVHKDHKNVMEFETTGVGAHAAMPEHSLNAAWKLADQLLKTGFGDKKANNALRFLAEHFGEFNGTPFGIACKDRISGGLTHIGGMTRLNDSKLVQNMNIRYPVTADEEKMSDSIRAECARCGVGADCLNISKPSHVPADLPEIAYLLNVCEEALGMENPRPYSMGGGTYARMMPKAVGFGPETSKDSPFGPERGDAHQPDEAASLDTQLRAAAVYAVSLMGLDDIVE